ncbi:MAG: Cache 3/Cache 2 fusion domain-containing protein [Sedimentisphaerales bacterium]|nr:Cache 3/Cache 2 fusion domain-containing protein [Sedimentisphaerales bacterium]
MTIKQKIILNSGLAVALTATTLVGVVLIQKSRLRQDVDEQMDVLAREQCAAVARDVYLMARTQQESIKQKVAYDLNVARECLNQMGKVSFADETVSWKAVNQYTKDAREIALAKMMVGGTWLGQNTDGKVPSPLVDKVHSLVGGTCTIFQRINEAGDMLRVCTNVEKLDGTRAVGTYIPAVNPDGTPNPVIAAVLKGETYNGRAYVVNDWYITAYEPIWNEQKQVVGVLYVGVKQENVKEIRQGIMDIVVGKTGYVYILGGTGDQKGQYIISQGGKRDGENIWDAVDAEGNRFIQSIVTKAIVTQDGACDFERYPWQNASDSKARWKLAAVTYFAPWDWVIGASAYEDDFQQATAQVDNALNRLMSWTGIGAAAAFLVCGFLTLMLARQIIRQIRGIADTLKDLSEGQGDLTKQAPMRQMKCSEMKQCNRPECPAYGKKTSCWDMVGSNTLGEIRCPSILSGQLKTCHECPVMQKAIRTEMDEMAAWFNTFLSKIARIIRKISHSSNTFICSSMELSATATQISGLTEEVSSRSQSVSAAAEQMTTNITNVAASGEQMSANVKTVASAAEEMMASISEIAKNAEQASQVADKAAELVKESNERIGQLGAAADEIGKVIEVIQDIAEQTNLLALNATIEAARAGDAGKGFAVVASEVKELAKQTAEATEDISRRITAIQTSSGQSVQAIDQISEVIKNVNDVSRSIASAVEEQSITTKEIAQNISQASLATETVTQNISETAEASKEITQNITLVDRATGDTASGTHRLMVGSTELSKLAEELQVIVKQFKIVDKNFIAAPIKAAHSKWKIRLAEMLSGKNSLDPSTITDHHECSFGKWYFGEGTQRFGNVPVYRQIDHQHEKVHVMAKQIAQLHADGKTHEAREHFRDFQEVTVKLFELLDTLESEIATHHAHETVQV